MMGYNYGDSSSILTLIVAIIVIALIFFIIRSVLIDGDRPTTIIRRTITPPPVQPPAPTPHERTALDILSERYAKGEIDKAEYDQKKTDILSKG